MIVANEGGWVDALDGTTLAPIEHVATPGFQPFGLALTPDETQFYVTAATSGRVLVIDRTTRKIVRTIDGGGKPRRIAFSPDGLTAFVANELGWVDVLK